MRYYRVKSIEMVIAKNVDEFEALSSEDLEVEEEEIVTQVKGRHVESGHKTLLRSSLLYQVGASIFVRAIFIKISLKCEINLLAWI